MTEDTMRDVRIHAARDVIQGRPWSCLCPICTEARSDPELVKQIQDAIVIRVPPDKIQPVPPSQAVVSKTTKTGKEY